MDKKQLYKNNCSSSSFLDFNGLKSLKFDINEDSNENTDTVTNSSPSKNYSRSTKNKKVSNLSLAKFMENQNKKRLTTNFAHKDVVIFLKEKDKAMEKIIIEDEMIKSKETNEKNDEEENNIINNKVEEGTVEKEEEMKLRGKKKNKNKNKKKIKEKKEEKIIDFVVDDDRDGGWETITNKKEDNKKKQEKRQEDLEKTKKIYNDYLSHF